MREKKPDLENLKRKGKEVLSRRLRDLYSVDEEFRIINLGIANAKNKEYKKYRKAIDSLVLTYKQETGDKQMNKNLTIPKKQASGITEKMGMSGKLKIELIRDGKVVQTEEVDNLITTVGKSLSAQLIAGSGTAFSHMAIGTTNTAAAIGDTALLAEAGRVTLTSKATTLNVIDYIADFPAGTGTGTIVEAGILNASTAGTMLNRAIFSAVNKTASEALRITWSITMG